jgi:glucokinase
MSSYALGIDVGATKVAIARISSDFLVLEKEEISTSAPDSNALWNRIAEVGERYLKNAKGEFLGTGIGSAGPLDIKAGTISPVNISIWRDFPIVALANELAPDHKVVLHGDALALAHAEHRLGAGRGLANMLGMVVSTGIGGGLVLDGKIFPGESGNSCFIGHHSINFEGRQCVCGRSGCLEAYSSGPQMVAIAKELGWKSNSDSFIELAASANLGDSAALASIDQGTRALAIGIVNFCGTLDINHVVIGGGVIQSGDIFWKPLQKHIKEESKAISFLRNIELKKAELERDAGVLGAALAILG